MILCGFLWSKSSFADHFNSQIIFVSCKALSFHKIFAFHHNFDLEKFERISVNLIFLKAKVIKLHKQGGEEIIKQLFFLLFGLGWHCSGKKICFNTWCFFLPLIHLYYSERTLSAYSFIHSVTIQWLMSARHSCCCSIMSILFETPWTETWSFPVHHCFLGCSNSYPLVDQLICPLPLSNLCFPQYRGLFSGWLFTSGDKVLELQL